MIRSVTYKGKVYLPQGQLPKEVAARFKALGIKVERQLTEAEELAQAAAEAKEAAAKAAEIAKAAEADAKKAAKAEADAKKAEKAK